MVGLLKKLLPCKKEPQMKEQKEKTIEEKFCDSACNISKANDTIDRIEAVLDGDPTWFLSMNRGEHV